MSEHGVQLVEPGKPERIERIFGVDGFGYALRLRAADQHYTAVGWEENSGVKLCDAVGVDAHVARDGLLCRIGASGRNL